ncbi:hypothetical protein GARC_0154 [Paraglaciecola arctica BSs20135]|uniref:Uncharacterized protein n=1 Tax=Paraglaciecola arctica BSs20135 TaxID=493475 RepID=K6XZP5_9ALTE|nr:hypothetical protein GARC_0154 [Paraglaciecola arctica BSs20135]
MYWQPQHKIFKARFCYRPDGFCLESRAAAAFESVTSFQQPKEVTKEIIG